ncbi:MAG TPA: DUF805 domain-containing protein [Croceibacterium sp.]|nr:DUF805 domain-containing protein [Croceibacterium sp.]
MEWMLMPLRRYADFSGRSRRMEYWMFQLLNLIVGVVIVVLIFGGLPLEALSNPEALQPGDMPGALFWIGVGLGGIWALGVLIPGIAVTVRRLHDRDMSGWWYLGFFVAQLIPLVGWIATIAFIVLMCLPGTSGPNRFGPDPLDPHQAEVFA